MMTTEHSPTSADHLAVLVHGLWGHPKHLNYVADALRKDFPAEKLHILNATRNAGSFTYDGVELGGERVVQEVEDTLETLKKDGHTIKKISFIGYSLGGLVARYAIGLLQHRGVFEQLEPVNFTTFATPHLGVRTPLQGITGQIWNGIGSRLLSASGRQMFLVDKFRGTDRPLLGLMADPDSIFIKGLSRFRNRSIYANVVNDRSVPYFTSAIVTTDPFTQLDSIDVNYVPGYDNVIVDGRHPASPKPANAERPGFDVRGLLFEKIPFYAFLGVFIPVALTAFSASSVYQTFRSQQRIQLHESGKAGIAKGMYRIPLLLQDVRQMGEDMYEEAAGAQGQNYLSRQDTTKVGSGQRTSRTTEKAQKISPATEKTSSYSGSDSSGSDAEAASADRDNDGFPTLALTPEQFAMVRSLNSVGLDKHFVHIHNARHSHAGIIVRMAVKRFEEGKVVVGHWLERFEV